MVKTGLYAKCVSCDFEKLFAEKGYTWFTKGDYNLNIIGIRKSSNQITNKYDDYLIVDYNTGNGHKRNIYSITTEPGKYYMKHLCNSHGTAILVPGQYKGCWQIGKHKGKYKALVQRKPVKVYRDGNKDNVYDLDATTINEGIYGINIHRSNEFYKRENIDMYSAGCQVFNDPSQFVSFITLCEKQRENFKTNTFTYTLLDEKDL